jgi:hypothetical protein
LGGAEPKSDLGESGSDTIPTQWSQAGDYEIKETPGQQTVVTNSKAGFSFKVPEGWSVKDENLGEEYSLNLLHPNAKLDQDNFLVDGCFINIETVSQQDQVININALIDDLVKNPNSRPDQEMIRVGERYALQTSLISSVSSDNPEIMKKIRDIIQVEIPLNQEIVVNFNLILKKSFMDQCVVTLSRLLSGGSF